MRITTILLSNILTVYFANVCCGWQRSALIYHIPNRSTAQWERHLMRVDENGTYTGQWMFDAAILTAESVNGKGVYVAHEYTGQDYSDFLDQAIGDALNLDTALRSIGTKYGRHPSSGVPFEVYLGMPYPNPFNRNVNVNGVNWDLSIPAHRQSLGHWYADEVKKRTRSKSWYNFNFGIYYHLEEAVDNTNDRAYLTEFNNYVHSIGMKTVWVPFFDASNAWNGKNMGFDYVSVQPRLSFLSAIDAGNLLGDRLYSTGYKCAALGQAIEYEARSQGESELEYWIAHQYLAVSQVTGSSAYPQVFFVGGPDIFDRVANKASATGFTWPTYQDLANYLGGATIENWKAQIPWIPFTINENLRQVTWKSTYTNLNAIRLDFNDFNVNNPWRGKLTVLVENDLKQSSFAVRVGTDHIDLQYSSVFVPLSNIPISNGTTITIQLSRESNSSPWPNVRRIIGAKFELKYVANSIFGETSSSSNPVKQLMHKDTLPTHLEPSAGRLTDGKISPSGVWWWDGEVGWDLNENEFSVSIDLGYLAPGIAGIKIFAYLDLGAGVHLPEKLGGYLGDICEPQKRGTIGGCASVASLGYVSKVQGSQPTQGQCYNATLTGQFTDNPAGIPARYVTVSGQCRGWCLLDEIQVLDKSGNVLSIGKKYHVTPASGNYDKSVAYADNSKILTDGAIFSDWMTHGSLNSVGLLLDDETKFVQAVWAQPRQNQQFGAIWTTKWLIGYGVGVPPYVNFQWRNEKMVWSAATQAPFLGDCGGGCPCAKLAIPPEALVTGLKGTFPASKIWVMVTEISLI